MSGRCPSASDREHQGPDGYHNLALRHPLPPVVITGSPSHLPRLVALPPSLLLSCGGLREILSLEGPHKHGAIGRHVAPRRRNGGPLHRLRREQSLRLRSPAFTKQVSLAMNSLIPRGGGIALEWSLPPGAFVSPGNASPALPLPFLPYLPPCLPYSTPSTSSSS